MRGARFHLVRPFLLAGLLSLFAPPASAQSGDPDPPPTPTSSSPPASPEGRSEALSSLFEAVQTKKKEVEQLRADLAEATEDVTRESLSEQLARRLGELRTIRSKFQETAAGVDESKFRDEEKEPFSWEQTLGRILEPILAEIEDATATSRKIATLEEEAETFSEQQRIAEKALENLARTREATDDPSLRDALDDLTETWERRRLLAKNQAQAARLRLRELEENAKGVTDYARKFLSTRGLHLLYGIGAALAVFFGVRLLFGFLRERKGRTPGLRSRLVSVLASLLSVVGAIAALLIVFSAAGDLFLVGIVLVFLIGAGWAGVRVLPEFVESLRLILNIGTVKEGERIVFDGIPWVVETLGSGCRLTNPPLDDAVLALPVKRLVGLHSRPFCSDEAVFPTERGDWVELDDGAVGRIVAQNPAHVVLEELGGARRAYPTPTFLGLGARKLSSASFRVQTRFGIDYAHQAIATEQVPAWFQAAIERGLPPVVGDHAVNGIQVQFAEAGASSLDYEIEVDLDGSAAALHEKVRFALQRILVDACNEHALVIPFAQITVHRASEDGA